MKKLSREHRVWWTITFPTILAVSLYFVLSPADLGPYRDNAVTMPSELEYFEAGDKLKLFMKARLRLVTPSVEKSPDLDLVISDLDKPTLFVLLRSAHNPKGYDKKVINKLTNNVEIGFDRIASYAAQINRGQYRSILVSINTNQSNLRLGIAKHLFRDILSNSTSMHLLGTLLGQRDVLNELADFIDTQDTLVGKNGYNPKNIALLAYYPNINKFAVIDDSQYLRSIRQDFWYGGERDYDPIVEEKLLYKGSWARWKFRSIPDSLVNKVSFNKKVKKLNDYLMNKAIPSVRTNQKKVVRGLLKQGIDYNDY